MKSNLPKSCLVTLTILQLVFISNLALAQTVTIDANPSQSVGIVVGNSTYNVTEAIYTETEIGALNFTTAGTAINHIDFSVYLVGANPIIDSFNVYFKEIPDDSTTLPTGVYDTVGFTKVYSGLINFSTTGWVGIDLTTSFIRTSNTNLQVLIERLDSKPHGGFSFNASRGITGNNTANSSRRANQTTLPMPGVTSLATNTGLRPRIQLRHITANDARISQVYTLGKLPIPFANPHVIKATIVNSGINTQTNLPVTLSVTGANTFTDVQNIPSLASGDTVIVSFAAFGSTATGTNVISISLPADEFNGDNNISVNQLVTSNAYNYASGVVASGATGYAGATGDFSALFTTSSPTSVNQVGVTFSTSGQPFNVVIWDKAGTGKPGAVLWESASQISTAGVFTMPVSPAVPVSDSFYVGIKQTGIVNIGFAYQSENPIRPNTFFFTQPTGNNNWTDLAPNSPFKFMIEPRLTLANDVGISSIANPVALSNIDNCGITPQVVVSNFGSANQLAPFSVTYQIKQGGTTVYTDTKSLTLNSGVSARIEFKSFEGAVSGIDSSIVYTGLASDAATNNDTVVNRFNTAVYSFTDSLANSGGYSYANSTVCALPSPNRPAYSWVTSTSSEINWGTNGDDSTLSTPVPLPFPFKFFGTTYNECWIASNGWISFTAPSLSPAMQRSPAAFPSPGGLNNYIAGLLANLDMTTSTYADAHTYYGGDATQMVITYFHAHLFGSATDYITFQIILKVNGDILVQYNDAESTVPIATRLTNSCAVGIENNGGTKGLQYRLNGSGGSIFGSPLALLFVAPQVALPVSLTSFAVQKVGRVTNATWATSLETNTSHFILERSADGRNFTPINRIAAAGNSDRINTYSFIDNTPIKGLNYYRLAINDLNGTKKYSDVKVVRNDGIADIAIYPSPVKGELNVVIYAEATDKASLFITNVSGQLLKQQSLNINKGLNKLTVNTAAFAQGTYLVKIKLQADLVVKKFNKQ